MKKKIVIVVLVISVITTVLSVNTFAFETGEYAGLWNWGLITNQTSVTGLYGKTYSYVYIPTNEAYWLVRIDGAYINNDNNNLVILDNTYSNEINYDIVFNVDNIAPAGTNKPTIIIPFKSNRNVLSKVEIIQGQDIVSDVNVEQIVLQSTNNIDYYGYYYKDGTYRDDLVNYRDTDAYKYTVDFNGRGIIKIKIRLVFADDELLEYINENHSTLYNIINVQMMNTNLPTVAGYVSNIINQQWIGILVIIQAISIILAIVFNMLRSL